MSRRRVVGLDDKEKVIRIKLLKSYINTTKVDAAKMLGITILTLNRYLKGDHDIPLSIVRSIRWLQFESYRKDIRSILQDLCEEVKAMDNWLASLEDKQ